ncbi:F0F1 ATP synthase subunit gamma [uncultured Cohaesibacter sp.]|uniref:F0F1 ATP synthase subunit gamma n=1 Tax=uncultured Cohaesibacter sp. TaxID=1002546 RepID=UPI0029C8CA80|nr:F0F1 ATP synthase subunit gamma [uncultured Cohaesibacter sp.]
MPSLKDLKNRIASVKATQKITKAMQMVAAAKLRRAQSAAENARPYAERMGEVLANVASRCAMDESTPKLLAGTGSDQTHLLLVCTAERGLCGGFNSSIARLARDKARALKAAGKTVKMICVGSKGFDALKSEFGKDIIDVVDMRDLKSIRFSDAEVRIGRPTLNKFEKGDFDVCTLFYAQFRSVVTQVPTAQQIIPAVFEGGDSEGSHASGAVYDYEPDEEEILLDLLPRNVSVQIYHALLENGASEQGARMSAMDNATRNAGEMIDKLELSYNRQRQAQITGELIEIISGAEAL